MTVTIAFAEGNLNPADVAAAIAAHGARLQPGSVASPEDAARTTAGADALLVTLQPLRAEHIAALADSVRVIVRAGVGLDTIDVEAARARGITVVYQPTYATNEVADQAASMALASWRRLASGDGLVRTGGWGAAKVGVIHSLQDSTLGVLGTGRIGRAVIARLRPFVKRIVVFDAFPDPSLEGVEWRDDVRGVLAEANLLTLHLPLLPETRHVIDAEAIAAMPDAAVVVNVSRGGLVDESALAAGLVSGKLAAAALDVFEHEPLEEDSPLRTAPNLILSPHIAWYSVESGSRLTRWSIEDAVAVLAAGAPVNGMLA
jgi:D-3-phosphoglycerate dehydrogenase